MDEQVIDDLYSRAKSQGYTKSRNEFITLLHSDSDVFNDMYSYVKSNGYQKSEQDFSALVGKGQPQPQPEEVKKKATTALPSDGTSLASQSQQEQPKFDESVFMQKQQPAVAEGTAVAKPLIPKTKEEYEAYKAGEPERKLVQAKKEISKLIEPFKNKKPEEKSYWGNVYDNLVLGINSLDQMVASIPESAINIFAIPQNAVAYATGWDIATNADKVKKDLGIRNVVLDKLKQEEQGIKQNISKYNKDNYTKEGVYDNIQNGNYGDAFKVLGSNIAQSVPVSIAMMYGGAALSPGELTAAGTLAFQQQNREQLEQDNPSMPEIEKNVKSLGMAAAETVFSSIGEGSIGQVYRDIAKKEGADAAKTILKDGLVETYKSALKKYGVPVGLLGEGLEEVATQVTQNVISGKPAFEGAADSFITGAGSGVVFTAPITAIEAKKRVNNLVETYKSKKEINDIMKDKDVDIHNIFNVSKNDPITPDQIQIANVNKSRDIFSKNLNRQLKDGLITKEDAQQSLYVFDKVQQVSNAVKDLNISNKDKAVVANLLRTRNDLKSSIENKEDVLVVKEKQQIDDINKQISDIVLNAKPEEVTTKVTIETPEVTQKRLDRISEIESILSGDKAEMEKTGQSKIVPGGKQELETELQTLKTEQDAFQKQAADESLLRSQQPELGLPQVGEGNIQPEVVTTGTEEVTVAKPGEEVTVTKTPEQITAEGLLLKPKETYETIPTEGVQPQLGTIRPETKAAIEPTGLAVPSQPSPKRQEVKSSIERIANAGLLRSAETGQPTITPKEIDAQMALTDAMARVWEETTGKNDFYETFISDVKEGDVEAIKQKGGALFQNTEVPQRPISRVTLGVFELPEFQKMKGKEIARQSITDLIKSRGKQIEKDIINTVIEYDKYKDQKRIPFDQFRDDVETQLMKLERIDTNTYASYGMDNLGDNHSYGNPKTIIFNSPIDHGQHGHFSNDFATRNLATKTWEIRQIPNTEQYVAVDTDMPSDVSQSDLSNYIGTAGPLADVERWVNDRNSVADREINKGLFGHIRNWFNKNTGVYTLAELQSDYFQKNKASDLYASKIPKEEVYEYINKNFKSKLDSETTESIKKEFNIGVKKTTTENGYINFQSFKMSEPDNILYRWKVSPSENYEYEKDAEQVVVIGALRELAQQDEQINKRRKEIGDEYDAKVRELKKEENKYITKRIEEIKKSEAGSLMLSQFVASQKVHELRLFREALRHAADQGATELWFPTPFTIANIEGYVSAKGDAPYEILSGDSDRLYPGDTIDYGNRKMIVVESSSYSITVAPFDEVSSFDLYQYASEEARNRMDELEYDLKNQVGDINAITKEEVSEYKEDEWMSDLVKEQLERYFIKNPDAETVSWSDIENRLSDDIEERYSNMPVEDLVSWAGDVYMDGDTIYAIESRRSTERFGQPDEYKAKVDEEDFQDDLSEDQETVVKKYDELGQMIKKMRPDAVSVRDDNGMEWIKTDITEADRTNPIIAFQEEGGKIKGAIDFSNDNKASVYIFDGADISTLAHEISGHLGRRVLEQLSSVDSEFSKDYESAKKWAGVKDNQWSREAEEKWARGFEKYLRTGNAPTSALKSVFGKLKDWLTNIYKTIKGSSIDIELTPEIINVFDNLLRTKAEKKVQDIFTADTKNATALQKVKDFLDKAEQDLERFGKETAGMNIAIPVMKAIIKSLKALVSTGITLQEAIRRVASDNNVTEQDVIDTINKLAEQRDQEAKPEGVSEIELPGYNKMMAELNGIIKKSKERGATEERTMKNAINYLQGSKVYQDASDTQRESMLRDVRKMFGVKEKTAPSVGKLLGEIKNVSKITMTEKSALIKQIKDLARGAKDAKKAIALATQQLSKDVKELRGKGKITTKQAANVVRAFSKVNVLNENSVSRFIDYMTRVFENADYADKIANINKKLKTAKANVRTKLGNAQNLIPALQKMLSINPLLIPESKFDAYQGLVDMLGERKAVLDLRDINEVTKTTNEILDAINEQESLVDELSERFNSYEDKVVDENGKLEFGETLNKMVSDGIITEQEADMMRKYKSSIVESVTNEGMTEEEIADEKKELIKEIKNSTIDTSNLSTKEEVKSAKKISKLLKEINLDLLTNAQLKTLSKIIDNINNGYLPHSAQLMTERLNAIISSSQLSEAIIKSKPLKVSETIAKMKTLFMKNGKYLNEMLKRGPSYFIDDMLGNFKSKDVFKSLFEKSAQGQAAFQFEVNNISHKLDIVQKKVSKSFSNNPNKVLMSSFKMMTYLIQKEFESNPGNKQVNEASKYIRETIKKTNKGETKYSEREVKMLEQILNNYTNSDGNIDIDKLYSSFNKAEVDALNTIREINDSLTEKALHTAAVIRGDKVNPLNNYVHLSVMPDYDPDADISSISSVVNYNNSLNPSTKAKTLIERTGMINPIDFDVFASVQNGTKQTLMDYYLTEPIRTARKILNEVNNKLEQNDSTTKSQWEVFNAIRNSFEESTSNLLMNSSLSNTFVEEVADEISKQGYRAILTSSVRFMSELASNIGFAILDPKAFTTGLNHMGIIMSSDGANVMNNVKSKQTNRLYHSGALGSRFIDPSIMSQASGVKGGRSKNAVANVIQTIHNNSTKKVKNFVELTADTIVSTPDKVLNRPMWFGSFANEFNKLTGEDVDFEKISENNDDYMSKYENEIEKAKDKADEMSVYAGASDNAYMGILKGANKPNQSILKRVYNNFNNFMTRFSIYEYSAARKGIYAAMGNGSLNKKQGAALLAAVITRMTTYTLLSTMLGNALLSALGSGDDEDEDEDKKSLMQNLGRATASASTGLLFGRDFGNAAKLFVNYGLEAGNEKFLGALREGEYDPYKDAISYSMLPKEQKGKQTTLSDFILQMGGAYGPALKTAELAVKKIYEPPKKKEDAIKRQKDELTMRLPLEVLGNLGYIPLYKDVRSVVMDNIYSDLKKQGGKSSDVDYREEYEKAKREERKAEKITALSNMLENETDEDKIQAIKERIYELTADKEEKKLIKERNKTEKYIKESLLEGYDTEGDLKKYDRKKWEQNFGEGSQWYEDHKGEAEVEREMNAAITKEKNEEYGYTPKRKSSRKYNSDGTIKKSFRIRTSE